MARVDDRFEQDVIPTPKASPLTRIGRVVGMLMAIVGFLGGTGLLMGAIVAQFDVKSMIRPTGDVAIYSSFDNHPLQLEAGSYAATSLHIRLTGCTVRSIYGGQTMKLTPDPYFTDRSVFRFDVGKGTYDVTCTPGEAWYEVYRGADVELAVKGYVGTVHPTVYLLIAAVPFFLVGSFFWARFVKRPRED